MAKFKVVQDYIVIATAFVEAESEAEAKEIVENYIDLELQDERIIGISSETWGTFNCDSEVTEILDGIDG